MLTVSMNVASVGEYKPKYTISNGIVTIRNY